MFSKKCSRCNNKIKKDHIFCPYCGLRFKKTVDEERDYGFLGKNDFDDLLEPRVNMPFGLNTLFNSLVKEVDKQFRELDKQMGSDLKKFQEKPKNPGIRKSGISISISSGGDKPPEIKVRRIGDKNNLGSEIQEKEKRLPAIDEEKVKKFANLPRKEADTKIRRLSNKIIYEINLPGVKSMKDVIINKLENSIEVKAFAKDKVLVKLIPIDLPLKNYKVQKEKLILEFRS